MNNAYGNELRGADDEHIFKDDVKKKNQITTHLKLTKFLKTFFFFATWPPLGKTAIPFSLEGLHKGSKIGECSKALSLGVSVTC